MRNERLGVYPGAKLPMPRHGGLHNRPHYLTDFGARDDKMDDGGELFVCVNEFNVFA
ncbi:MAG: hypothetical protein ACR65O_15630 [Methylomicrobium sp.]